MSEFFVDTSALAKRYLTETGAKWVRRLMRPSAGNIIMVAELSRVEMSSLLNRHLRFGTLPPRSLKRIGNNFLRHLQSEYFVIPIDRQLLIVASELTNKHPLRALDAIQLACAVRAYNIAPQNPLTFISADTTLLATAASEGFTIDNPNNHP